MLPQAVRKSDLSVAMPAPPGTWRSDPMEDILREISIMKTMQHPNIVSLFEIIDDPVGNKLLLVMEYMDGGPLLTREALDRRERVSECLARRCFRDMIKVGAFGVGRRRGLEGGCLVWGGSTRV